MKYIRLAHAIFEVVEEKELVYRVKSKGNPHNIYSKSKCQNDVIKEADTIEELCDGLIVEEKDNESNWFIMEMQDFVNMPEQEKPNALKNWNFHAFIKTDKGLEYVAEPDAEGELELL